ncbi:MAG: tetratricopeptide repeat protein [Terriglobia bacterium]
MTNVEAGWDDILETPAPPEWLTDFDHDAYAAVDAALWQAYYFGNLNVADPADLLIDWALGIGERNGFVTRLDVVLAQWIQRNWGRQPEAQGTRSAAALAHAWMQLAQVIANVPALIQAPRALRANFADCQAYLGPLCEGFSRDPLAGFLLAVARHQEDRSLLPVWWNYCDLTPDIPWHHGSYGVMGLRGLPAEDRGGFPEHVAYGLLRLGLGLYKRSLDKSLEPRRAEAEFQRIARLTLRAYPFPTRWRECWADQIYALRKRGEPIDGIESWLSKLVPGLDRTKADKQHSSFFSLPPNWADEARRIAGRLRSKAPDAIAEAKRLRDQQWHYAEKAGDSSFVCRTLTRFATAVSEDNPQLALQWAEESRVWEPWNPYTWNVLTGVLRRDRKIDEALEIAWAAIDRFPDNVVARTGLAEVLKAAEKLTEAEAVYRETVDRFPDNVVARNGLAEVLKAAEKLTEAEAVYRETVDRFPDDVVARTGLAYLMKDAHKLQEAEAVFREALAHFPRNNYVLIGLASVLRLTRKDDLTEAFDLIERARAIAPSDAGVLLEQALLYKTVGRMEEAEAILQQVCALSPASAAEGSKESMAETDAGSFVASVGSRESAEADTLAAERKLRPRITSMQARAISAHARLLRHWARRNETNGTAQPTPANLRTRAIALLDQLIDAKPYQTNARAERALLLLEAGQAATARQFLSESIALFSGDTSLRYAMARVEREIARQEKRRLADVTSERVTSEWKRLASRNPSFLPLEQLGGARALLAHRDGQEVREGALKSFSKMRQWMQPHLDFIGASNGCRDDDPESVRDCYSAKEGFENWWSREVQAYLFGSVHIDEALTDEHLNLITQRLDLYERPIDTLEEDFAVRNSQ